MKATAGDRIVVKAHGAGQAERDGEVLEVRGDFGESPYLVRWSGSNKAGWYFPGPDTVIEHLGNGHEKVPPVREGSVGLRLADDQLALLRDVLDTAINDLSPEIADTDNASYRRRLIERREALRRLLDALVS